MSENSLGVPTIFIYVYIYNMFMTWYFSSFFSTSWTSWNFGRLSPFFGRSWPTFWHRRRRATSAQSVGAWGIHKDSRLESPLEIPTFDVSTKSIIWWCFSYMFVFSFKVVAKVEDVNLLWGKRIGIPWTLALESVDESLSLQGSCHGWAHVWGTWVTS